MTALPGAYRHPQYMQDTGALAESLTGIGKLFTAMLPYLNAVGAGPTQTKGAIGLAEEGKSRGASVIATARKFDAQYRDLNGAVAAARGDRAENKHYAQ
jgi:hypothetical protein